MRQCRVAERKLEPPVAINNQVRVVQGDLPSDLALALAGEAAVACDLETSGLDWHSDVIGTVQLYGPSVGAVIVTAFDEAPTRLVSLLETDSVEKVFHHAPFDLCFLANTWGVETQGVSCTKIASKLAQPAADPSEHSLASLLKARLGVTIDKGPVRTSNWTGTSLNEEQVSYAANDVRYLLPLLDDLRAWLTRAGRSDLYGACCRFLPAYAALQIHAFPDVFLY
jgi:ribonuclease D